ncbi:MAG: hypothetical protein ACOXZ9_07145 [Bacteroidales bacterium]|jgi:hypothetical protein
MTDIVFYNRNEIDVEKWNCSLKKARNYNVYADSFYLDVVSPGWSALVSEDYKYLFPLPNKKKFGINYIIQPVLSQQLGLFSENEITADILFQFINKIPKRYGFVKLFLNEGNVFDNINMPLQRNYTLQIPDNRNDIRNNYSTNLKRNLKIANAGEIEIVSDSNPNEIISLFKRNKQKELENFNSSIYGALQKLCKNTNPNWQCKTYKAVSDNKTVSGMTVIEYGCKSIFLFSGNSEAGKEIRALPYLIDWYLHNCDKKIKIFDFEGSNDDGLARFYSSFGADKVDYAYYFRKSRLLFFVNH